MLIGYSCSCQIFTLNCSIKNQECNQLPYYMLHNNSIVKMHNPSGKLIVTQSHKLVCHFLKSSIVQLTHHREISPILPSCQSHM